MGTRQSPLSQFRAYFHRVKQKLYKQKPPVDLTSHGAQPHNSATPYGSSEVLVDPHASPISANDPQGASPIPAKRPVLRKKVVVPLLAIGGTVVLFALQMGLQTFQATTASGRLGKASFSIATPRNLQTVRPPKVQNQNLQSHSAPYENSTPSPVPIASASIAQPSASTPYPASSESPTATPYPAYPEYPASTQYPATPQYPTPSNPTTITPATPPGFATTPPASATFSLYDTMPTIAPTTTVTTIAGQPVSAPSEGDFIPPQAQGLPNEIVFSESPIFFASISPSSYHYTPSSNANDSSMGGMNDDFFAAMATENGSAAGAAGAASEASEYQIQNMQSQKEAFLEKSTKMGDVILPEILPPEQTIYPGTLIPIALVTGIHTDLPGTVIARVTAPIYDSSDGQNLLIPSGSTLTGKYDSHISYGQKRVLIIWDTLIRRDGIAVSIGNMPGVDLQGMAGTKQDVNTHFWQKLGAVALSTLVDLGQYELRFQANQQGVQADVAEGFGDSASSGIEKNQDFAFQRQPTITIDPGSALRVVVTAPILLPAMVRVPTVPK